MESLSQCSEQRIQHFFVRKEQDLRIEQGKGYQRRYGQGRCGCGLVVEPLGPEILDVDLEVFAPLVYFCMSPTGSHITVWHISTCHW